MVHWRGCLHAFRQSGQKNALAPSFYLHIRAFSLGYIRGDIKSIYAELALSGGKNERAVTDTVFSPISQVCTRGVILTTFARTALATPGQSNI